MLKVSISIIPLGITDAKRELFSLDVVNTSKTAPVAGSKDYASYTATLTGPALQTPLQIKLRKFDRSGGAVKLVSRCLNRIFTRFNDQLLPTNTMINKPADTDTQPLNFTSEAAPITTEEILETDEPEPLPYEDDPFDDDEDDEDLDESSEPDEADADDEDEDDEAGHEDKDKGVAPLAKSVSARW